MNDEDQTNNELAVLRRKLGHINRAIAELEKLQKTETPAKAGSNFIYFANVVSIDYFKKKKDDARAQTAQCPPATSVEG